MNGSVQRPTVMTVFGILNVILGAMGLLGAICSGVIMKIVKLPHNSQADVLNSPEYQKLMAVSTPLSIATGLLLLIAGFGLLKPAGWGRTLSLVYGVCAIISGIAMGLANYFLLLQPMIDRQGDRPEAISGMIGGLCGGVVGLIYPVLLLIFMLRLKWPPQQPTIAAQPYQPPYYPPPPSPQ